MQIEEVAALEVAAGNVNVGSLPRITVKYRGAWLRSCIRHRVLQGGEDS